MNTFYFGVIEDRTTDPLKLGRCKVRVFGLHSPDKIELPTEDLPWAVVMQPVTSAALSGIGVSPTGLVEGATVVLIFQDSHLQQPIIIGSVAGIVAPHVDQMVEVVATSESVALTTSDGTAVTDGSGAPITTGATTPKAVPEIKKATSSLVPSADCYDKIRQEESFSSIVQGKNKYIGYQAFKKLPDDQIIYPYLDTAGVWTIGWGSTYLANNSKVTENTRLTVKEADELLYSKVNKEFAPGIRRNLKAPVTQSMFDALVAMAYNAGVGGVSGSAVMAAVNSTEYEQAASQILFFKTNNGTLSARRGREKTLFSKDGFPRKDMSGIEPPPDAAEKAPPDATQNPVVTPHAPENTVKPELRKVDGFRDPKGIYPKIVNEPDTHRLTRHEKIDQTVVFSKESARAVGIVSGPVTWNQPPIPYNAIYPFNHVRVSESGHIQETDDTPGNERTHSYHRSGTFEEVDVNGTRVNRIVGDDFEIVERNGHVLIRGSMNVTIIGNNNIRVENDSNIDVLGNVNMTVGGSMKTGVTGSYRIACGGEFSVDASRVDWNSGKGSGGGKGSAGGVPEFGALVTPTRFDAAIVEYDTPEDGNPDEHVKNLEKTGAIDTPEPATIPDEPMPPPIEAKPVPVTDCSMVPQGPFDPSFRLSPNFTVKHMIVTAKVGVAPLSNITNAELVCNMKALAENCLEPIKKLYPNMSITSGYRNFVPPGGSTTSDHMVGAAADINLSGFTREQYLVAIQEIAKVMPAWSQLILESIGVGPGAKPGWIHISFNQKRGLRMERLTMNSHKVISRTGFVLAA